MTNRLMTAGMAGVLAMTCACVPILPHDEYVPAMAGSKTIVEHCWGGKSVEFHTEGMTLTSHIIQWPEGKLKLALQLDVVEGNTVELLSPIVTVTSKGGLVRETRIPGSSPTGNPSLPLEQLGPMSGRDIVIYGMRSVRHFWLFAPMEDVVSDDMRVALPKMRINDRIVSLPEIQFSRQVRLQLIAPIQC